MADLVLSAARNASKELLETVECTQTLNATGREGVVLCKPVTRARGYDEQSSYSMLIQAAYGLSAITILVVAYFIFRAMRFALCLTSTLMFINLLLGNIYSTRTNTEKVIAGVLNSYYSSCKHQYGNLCWNYFNWNLGSRTSASVSSSMRTGSQNLVIYWSNKMQIYWLHRKFYIPMINYSTRTRTHTLAAFHIRNIPSVLQFSIQQWAWPFTVALAPNTKVQKHVCSSWLFELWWTTSKYTATLTS